MNNHHLIKAANILSLLGIIIVLVIAGVVQLQWHDLPCPLCLLQRAGLSAVALGFLLNLRFGARSTHYAISLFACIFTVSVAVRQTLLHIVPGTGSYGSAIFGLHLYVWVIVICAMLTLWIALLLLCNKQFLPERAKTVKTGKFITMILFLLIVGVMLFNIVSTYLECGLKQCPDNPVKYELISQ